ncbi:MAG: mandelate racemase/muconate lactonizing enzyme family protein [Roseiflexaceae bacterium]|nr:mandelate racemase/muconate lactonizing enzyme family protein [Roseiflexaceae bacterium]
MAAGNDKQAQVPPIEWLETWCVTIPLDRPLIVFGRPVTTREFVFVRVGAAGKVGTGFAFTRGLPIDTVIRRQLESLVIGQPASAIRQIWTTARSTMRMIGEGGSFARALAVVDIALWDLLGHMLGAPLWQLLGGSSRAVPCLAICGYYGKGDHVADVRHEAEQLATQGYTRFKIPFGADLDLDIRRIAALRDVVGPHALVALDAGAAFNSVKAAQAAWRQIEQFDIAFLEDPFSANEWNLALHLANTTTVPVAFGESLASPAAIQRLGGTQGIDVVRPDATHQLGVTGYIQGVAPALEHGRALFPHYFPDIHAPLVAAFGGMMIEESPTAVDTVGLYRLRATQPAIRNGYWYPNGEPGFGIHWDDHALQQFRTPTPS